MIFSCHILGNAGQCLGYEFYAIPNLPQSILSTVFTNLDYLPDYRIKPFISILYSNLRKHLHVFCNSWLYFHAQNDAKSQGGVFSIEMSPCIKNGFFLWKLKHINYIRMIEFRILDKSSGVILKPFIVNCPKDLYSVAVIPLLEFVCPYFYQVSSRDT